MQRELAEGSQPPALAGTTGRAAGTVPRGRADTPVSRVSLGTVWDCEFGNCWGRREMKNGFVSLQGERKNSAW